MNITIGMLDSFPGSYMPKTGWLLYAGNEVAPLCRKPGGSYMAEDDKISQEPSNLLVEHFLGA